MNPILQLDSAGNFTYNGQPFLWAAFFKRGVATSNPVDSHYFQVPPNDPFVYNGVQYPGGSYVLVDSNKNITVVTAEVFASSFTDKGNV